MELEVEVRGMVANEEVEEVECRTPKAAEAKILAALVPPPAPRKRRMESPSSRRLPARSKEEFFNAQEVEEFFASNPAVGRK
ncbi:hypothetical protein IEQ34_018483 [Dendrobium chrysotoxum]|uniref:Uncharacterized protein n=1 Tax=Dendrobium chrysotoxum TaxID=161865 RepID=A0AAV7FNN0_DENCH|nr:hypothetical protein IEQ34_018483 [Dendrobium chrysotoxum]